MRRIRVGGGLAIALFAFLGAACGAEEDAPPPATTAVEPVDDLADATWLLRTGLGPLETLTTAPPTLTIEQETVSGFAGCNTYTGAITVDGAEIRIEDVATTFKACPEAETVVEEAFLESLASAATWSVVDDELRLADADGSVLMRLGPATIEGSWRATGIRTPDGEAVESVPAGVDQTISFFRNGTVTGSAGCNDFSGTFTVVDETLALSDLATTELACDAAVMGQEAAYLDALGRTTQLRLGGDTLDLLDDTGGTLIIYERGAT